MSQAHDILPPDFGLDQQVEAGVLRLVVSGELDIATAPQLTDTGTAFPDGITEIVVDLLQVTFVDSSGLRGLLLIHRHARKAGLELRIVHDPDVHGSIFRLTQLDAELPLVVADG